MGRTRSFDKDEALERAMRLFWRHGYEGTSLDELTAELGIARPSLYAEFGNKRALFELALARYAAVARARLERALAEPRAEAVARTFLRTYTDVAPGAPPGCLLVQGALACSRESTEVQQAVAARRGEAEQLLARRFARAEAGELPRGAKPADAARYLCTIAHGLAIDSDATPAQRRRVVELALAGWPTASRRAS